MIFFKSPESQDMLCRHGTVTALIPLLCVNDDRVGIINAFTDSTALLCLNWKRLCALYNSPQSNFKI